MDFALIISLIVPTDNRKTYNLSEKSKYIFDNLTKMQTPRKNRTGQSRF